MIRKPQKDLYEKVSKSMVRYWAVKKATTSPDELAAEMRRRRVVGYQNKKKQLT